MYINALRDLIKDLINLCGEDNNAGIALRELNILNKKIERLENLDELKSYEKTDLDIAKVRKEHWENSASYLGNEIVEGFKRGEDKEKLISLFNTLFDKASQSFKELNTLLIESNNKTIWDLINKKNIDLIKNKSKRIQTNKDKTYSNIVNHYKSKKELIENVIKSLNEKKIIVDETITLYQKIILNITDEIKSNNDTLLMYNEKKYMMAYSLCEEEDYILINEEIDKLREIKTFNESQLKIFNSELEAILKEKETIEQEINIKKDELKDTVENLKEFTSKTLEGLYVSKEDIVKHNFEVKEQEKELEKLNLQKNLLYVNLDRIKDMGIEILSNYSGISDEMNALEGEFTNSEVRQIEDMINTLQIPREEAIKALEVSKAKEKEDAKISEYMDEFDFSIEEAKEAIEKEKPENKFWDVD